MALDADAYAAIARFDAAMQQLDVPYALVGSVAWTLLYGQPLPRYRDIDFIADFNDSHLEPLCEIWGVQPTEYFPSPHDGLDWWLSAEFIDSARARCMCQADYIWLPHLGETRRIPIHVFIAHNYPSRWICLQRAQRYIIHPDLGTVTYLPHVEDLLIGEIAWSLDCNWEKCRESRNAWQPFCDRFNLSLDRIFTRAEHYRKKEGHIYKHGAYSLYSASIKKRHDFFEKSLQTP